MLNVLRWKFVQEILKWTWSKFYFNETLSQNKIKWLAGRILKRIKNEILGAILHEDSLHRSIRTSQGTFVVR